MKKTNCLVGCLLLVTWYGFALDADLFCKPMQEHHPETWFHFIGGNVAAAGVTADLEAIRDAGISGVQFFHGQFGGPWPGVSPQIPCLSPQWDDLVRHVASECQRLGLTFKMQNCPGWAMSGGPWIAPSNAMRNLVYSRTDVRPGTGASVQLPLPPQTKEEWRDYQDVAVLAFPTPEGDTGKQLVPASVSNPMFQDPFAGKKASFAAMSGTNAYSTEFSFERPVVIRSVVLPSPSQLNHSWSYEIGMEVRVEALTPNGVKEVAHWELPQGCWQDNEPITIACDDEASARWRFSFRNRHDVNLAFVRFSSAARESNWEGLAATTLRGLVRVPQQRQSRSAWISPDRILDLTKLMDAEGRVSLAGLSGNYTILRIGHVNPGYRNGPAPKEGTGWECNKLSKRGADVHFAGYIGRLKNEVLGKGQLSGLLMDSWECRRQTWTYEMEEEFLRLRKYELRRWLPAVFGWVIDNPETTWRFLRDWRQTISDLCVNNFYGRMSELAHKNGLKIQFETAFGDVFPGDLLEFWKYADEPMCEFWQPHSDGFVGSFNFKPVKPCVSAARMYGKKRVAAEAFTSFALTWDEKFRMLKQVGNLHYANGVTHFVFHTYTHNPRIGVVPGTSFANSIGTPFLRGQTWWKWMPQLTEYFARCETMLETGLPVSDVLWYLGDELGHKPLEDAPFPAGYKYDYCNADALLNRIRIKDGKWTTPEGIAYRVLWLPDTVRMLPETVERIVRLARAGGVVAWDRLPAGNASLTGGNESSQKLQKLLQEIWTAKEKGYTAHRIGKGRIYVGTPLADVLRKEEIAPDVVGNGVMWCHRQDKDADWYFVCADKPSGFNGALRFRAGGKVSVWDPVTGKASTAVTSREQNGMTTVMLQLPPSASCFLVFNHREEQGVTVVSVTHDGKTMPDAWAVSDETFAVHVEQAVYEAIDNAELKQDVTQCVRKFLAEGGKSLRVTNGTLGGDPAYRHVKRFRATLRDAAGKRWTVEADEGKTVELVKDGSALAPKLPYDALPESAGIIAWKPGSYEVTLSDGSRVTNEATRVAEFPLSGPWNVEFPEGWGMRDSYTMPELKPWRELRGLPETPYFSGTATYTISFPVNEMSGKARYVLDLGRVESIASVRLNERKLPVLWAEPYRVDVSSCLHVGVNVLVIEVTDTWHNRLVFDAGQPQEKQKTWTIRGPSKDAPLRDSGLIGPVVLRVGECFPVVRAAQ